MISRESILSSDWRAEFPFSATGRDRVVRALAPWSRETGPQFRRYQHNAGTASRYTRSRLPAVLVYQEAQASRSHALKREMAIKALSRQEKESMIREAGPSIASDSLSLP